MGSSHRPIMQPYVVYPYSYAIGFHASKDCVLFQGCWR